MASRKNRSSKSNRKSPKSLAALRAHFGRHSRRLLGWLAARKWQAVAAGFGVLFVGSLIGGYWAAGRYAPGDRGQVARETTSAAPQSKYASIDQIPGLPRYTEPEPGNPQPTHEERPRSRRAPLVAVAATAWSPAWRRNAVPFADLASRPLVAIVIDDVGIDRPRSRRAWELPAPLTLSFLPYARDLSEQARAAHARGHELMLHLPMEPTGHADPGPGALLVSMSDRELAQRVTAALDSFDGYVGVNNHMGSRFTAYRPGMETVLRLFKARGLLFLDSRTSAQTVGDQVAQELGLPSMVRNVFLDDDESIDAVRRKLAETEIVARRQGFVVAIGHPHEATLRALAEWLPGLAAKGLAQAPASAVLRKRNGWD